MCSCDQLRKLVRPVGRLSLEPCRGSDLSRTIPDCFWKWFITPASRMTRSDRSTMRASTPLAERSCLKLVLGRVLPPLWSGYWWEMDHRSPLDLRKISPVLLRTQSPAKHHPAVQSNSQSPPQTEVQGSRFFIICHIHNHTGYNQ